MAEKIHSEPSHVSADQGTVVVDGPDGVAVSLTPEAAVETSERLLRAGTQARGQQIQHEQAERRRKPQS
ncbi:MAG: hypothetical protein JWN69_261 [Alphaproteobacteria bacterium]|nr:hypothetical protein [Alphaproteobacteria bacterium]